MAKSAVADRITSLLNCAYILTGPSHFLSLVTRSYASGNALSLHRSVIIFLPFFILKGKLQKYPKTPRCVLYVRYGEGKS